MWKRAGIVLCIVFLISTLQVAKASDGLYGSKGIVPEAVVQENWEVAIFTQSSRLWLSAARMPFAR